MPITGALAAAGGEWHRPDPADLYQPFFSIGPVLITRPMVIMLISTLLIMGLLWLGVRNLKMVPGKGQFFLESIYSFVRNDIALNLIGGQHFKKYVPLLFTFFLFVFTMNFMGLFPLTMTAPTSVIGVPIALTAIAYITYHLAGIQKKGLGGYFGSMVPSGVPGWIKPVVFVLELFSYFITRPLTLALRLFGNMFAGHMLIVLFVMGGVFLLTQGPALALAGAGSLLMGALMFVFKMLIMTVQAYVFTLLTASYIGDAVSDDH
ncbi:F0F1 ATP synthase subunit A [Ornithinimicrobium sp. Y1847]|uniref:F0F1 ATP synthase subunit A n=1 Tax=unclassified Ornithinimicrobium TaxID=2615080 RepID=UPI003B676BCB